MSPRPVQFDSRFSILYAGTRVKMEGFLQLQLIIRYSGSMPPSSSVPRRGSRQRIDRHDNALCRFDDLASIQAQIFPEARRQDLDARTETPVSADRHR